MAAIRLRSARVNLQVCVERSSSANYDKGSTSIRAEPKDGEIVVEGGGSLNPEPPHSRETSSIDN